MIEFKLQIKEYTIENSYSNEPDKVGVYHASGEGADFDKAALEEVLFKAIDKFYKDNF